MGVIRERFVAKVSDSWLFFLKFGGFLWKCLGNQCVKIIDVLSLEVDIMLLIAS